MIKIRPITAQINTQKFISNFSSLLARAGMVSIKKSPPQALGPPAPRPGKPAPPLPRGVRLPRRLLPRPKATGPSATMAQSGPGASSASGEGPSPPGRPVPEGCCRGGVLGRRRLGWRWKLLKILPCWKRPKSCCDPENPIKREVSHPQTPERHRFKSREAKIQKREERESPEWDRI